ncbi:substrate-binding periplasmic protein [Psychrobium sp. nBUS_13]|uniref:substrate-binding periplasmic protein n=1 Tax=Psychrobium sp. nBUS_13 TaxID=3395319 RepID=UPI003EC05608
MNKHSGLTLLLLIGSVLFDAHANQNKPHNKVIIKHYTVTAKSQHDQRDAYYLELLRLVLEKTKPEFGDYQLKPIAFAMNQQRALMYLGKENVDVVWSMTSQERESLKHSTPIYIPLIKGLLGYRIFIIRKGEQNLFSKIKTLDELKSKVAGQGNDWPDYHILQQNNLPVISSSYYGALFEMLQLGRFDYFPRGVMEPWTELPSQSPDKFEIEQELMLHYPTAVYFFIANNNPLLKQRITHGLNLAMADGSFEELLCSHPNLSPVFDLANMEQRRVFELENNLSDKTRALFLNKSLWFDFTSAPTKQSSKGCQ